MSKRKTTDNLDLDSDLDFGSDHDFDSDDEEDGKNEKKPQQQARRQPPAEKKKKSKKQWTEAQVAAAVSGRTVSTTGLRPGEFARGISCSGKTAVIQLAKDSPPVGASLDFLQALEDYPGTFQSRACHADVVVCVSQNSSGSFSTA